jgi:hypothetical protein
MSPVLLSALQYCGRIFNHYVFDDWNALAFLMVVFLLDTGLGVTRSFKQGRFHSRGMRQMFPKLRDYGVGIILAHVFTSIEVDGARLSWVAAGAPSLKYIVYTFILICELKSIDENLRLLGGKGLPVPPFLRKRMQDWEETGEFRSKEPPTPSPAEEGVSDTATT